MSTVYCERGWPLSLMRVVLYILCKYCFYIKIQTKAMCEYHSSTNLRHVYTCCCFFMGNVGHI